MRTVGFLAGVGSLLRPAQDEGCDVVGNIDPRPLFRSATWLWDLNFPGVPLVTDLADLEGPYPDWYDADLAIGHPPCGRHSNLGDVYSLGMDPAERERRRARRATDAGHLPTFVRLVARFQPKVFALDNLWKIVDFERGVVPTRWWLRYLHDYQLAFCRIVNWDYGCAQVRERLWVIGTREDQAPFRLRPIDRRPTHAATNTLEALMGLPHNPDVDIPEIAHVHLRGDDRPQDSYWTTGEPPVRLQTVADVAAGFLQQDEGKNWLYRSRDGRLIRKPGHARLHSQRPFCRTLTRTPSLFHPVTAWPLTPRERARLMGWPDDFKLTDGRPFSAALHYKLAAITGQAVPSEFPRYRIRQIGEHLAGRCIAA